MCIRDSYTMGKPGAGKAHPSSEEAAYHSMLDKGDKGGAAAGATSDRPTSATSSTSAPGSVVVARPGAVERDASTKCAHRAPAATASDAADDDESRLSYSRSRPQAEF